MAFSVSQIFSLTGHPTPEFTLHESYHPHFFTHRVFKESCWSLFHQVARLVLTQRTNPHTTKWPKAPDWKHLKLRAVAISTWKWWRWCRGFRCRRTAAQCSCQTRGSQSSWWPTARRRGWTAASLPTSGAADVRSTPICHKPSKHVTNCREIWTTTLCFPEKNLFANFKAFAQLDLCICSLFAFESTFCKVATVCFYWTRILHSQNYILPGSPNFLQCILRFYNFFLGLYAFLFVRPPAFVSPAAFWVTLPLGLLSSWTTPDPPPQAYRSLCVTYRDAHALITCLHEHGWPRCLDADKRPCFWKRLVSLYLYAKFSACFLVPMSCTMA